MEPQNDALTTAVIGLQHLRHDMILVEQQVRAGMAADALWYAQQLSGFQLQLVVFVDLLATLGPTRQGQSGPALIPADRDQCWHALKAAVQMYRRAGPPAKDHA